MAMQQIPLSFFGVFALALPFGLSFRSDPPKSAWRSEDEITVCALTRNTSSGRFGTLIMRRREDDVWVVLRREVDIFSESSAMAIIKEECNAGACKIPLPPCTKRRRPLAIDCGKLPSNIFMLLADPCREWGAWMLNQLYLAMPNPDENWASDCRTGNFHARLWEAILFASLREQGLAVTQDVPSPDFHVSNRKGDEAWIEVVTANPQEPYDHANAIEVPPPLDRSEIVLGAAAVRYAKTIKSKLDKGYARMPHVSGKPFVLAVADFHAPGSMVWSRSALLGYLYGFIPREITVDGKRVAMPEPVKKLLGDQDIPAGLFCTQESEELSAIIFSQAATITKLSRVPVSFGAPTAKYRYVRMGEFADFTPGALRGKPFSMDVQSNEYRSLWTPYNYEPWTAEVEVFHNPHAKHPINPELFPEAANWLDVGGTIDCKRFFQESILHSRTSVQSASAPIPAADDLVFQETFDSDWDCNFKD